MSDEQRASGEQCCRKPCGSGSDCSGSLRDACTCICHYTRKPLVILK